MPFAFHWATGVSRFSCWCWRFLWGWARAPAPRRVRRRIEVCMFVMAEDVLDVSRCGVVFVVILRAEIE